MEQQNFNYQDNNVFIQEEGVVAKKFFANVFLWMFIALSISTFAAYSFGANESLMGYLISINPSTGKAGMSIFGYIAMFSPLALVLIMGAGFQRLSYSALLIVFVLFSLLLGISLSFILLSYTSSSVVTCFAAAAGIFGIMAFLGYTTEVDLSKFGPILLVGVAGLFIAGIINMFIQSEQFSLMMAFIGIAVFTALTAYDVQKIKRIGLGLEENGAQMGDTDSKKLAIMAALSLYLDFVNIFLYLLRIFGDRK
ncbi:MAG: Bax inhibitor-1/YccA family protein [Sphingobacteriaceae bacterium]|nr:Bax inhibitor-1/YccA family protein [Sphingobacteriaceae bacterium]